MSRISQLKGSKACDLDPNLPRVVLLADCNEGRKVTECSQINVNKNAAFANLPCVLPSMHHSVFHSSAKPRRLCVRSFGYRFKSIHWYHIICTSMLLCCVHGDGCDFFSLPTVAEGFHATTWRFSPPASKLCTCSYWIFHKEIFHCDSLNPEPFTAVMSYLPTMSGHF